MSFLLDAAAEFDPSKQFGEEGGYQKLADVFKNGGQYFLLGMLAVFAVLGFIWIAIELFHRFCSAISPKAGEKAEKKTVPAPAPATVPAVTVQQDDTEIIAVIMAAIQAAQEENPHGTFRVVSFRKK